MPNSQNHPTKSLLQKQAIATLIGILAFALFFWGFSGILGPFILGFIVAYFLDPVVDRLEVRGMSRGGGTAIVLFSFIILVVALIAVAFPLLQDQFNALVDALPAYIEKTKAMIEPWTDKLRNQFSALQQTKIQEQVNGQIKQQAPGVARAALYSAIAVFDFISFLFIAPVVAFYMLRDWDSMLAKIDSWIPRQHVKVVRVLAHDMDMALSGFVRGQALVCLLLGTFYAVALTISGLDFGFFIGFAAGVLTFMPFVGTISGFMMGILVGYVQYDGDMTHMAIIVGIFCIGQFLEGNFLTPKIVGGRVGLHELWIIFSLMAGGMLMGFTGLLLAVPMAAMIGVLSRFLLRQYLASSYYKAGKKD